MKLVIAKRPKKKVKPRVAKGASAVKSALLLTSNDLNKLKPGSKLYVYINESGKLGNLAGVFDKDLTRSIYTDKLFEDAASYTYTVIKDFDPTHKSLERAQATFALKGSRIEPSYLEIKKVTPIKFEDQDAAFVVGDFHNVYDPRLSYLEKDESTEFGSGTFDFEKVLALYDGSYFYPEISPHAEKIAQVVEEQKEIFNRYATRPDLLKEKLKETQRLLRPHAHEIFKYEDDFVFFITKKGLWQCFPLVGPRKPDVFDRHRIAKILREEGAFDKNIEDKLLQNKKLIAEKPIYDRFSVKDNAALYAKAIKETLEADEQEVDRIIKETLEKRPSHGVDVAYPGLKEGISFFPHQSLILAKTRNRDRLPLDADPGAGKMLMIIADILQQVDLKRVTRPLIVVPQNLVDQCATEIQKFTHYNPWIINTHSINRWKDGSLETMLEDAKKAPRHTIFVTSYEWLSIHYEEVPNGQIRKTENGFEYKTSKKFKKSLLLLNELGIDGVYADEFHILRKESNRSIAAATLAKAPVVRGLTGTLFPGNLIDATGSCGVVHSYMFGSVEQFLEDFSPNKSINSYYKDAPKQIRKRLKEFGVPQIRSTAWAHLMPKVQREYRYVEFSKNQQKHYEDLLEGTIESIEKDPALKKLWHKFLAKLKDGNANMSPKLLARFVPLEKFLNAPDKAAPHLTIALDGDDAISPKVKEINEICSNHLSDPNNGKIIVFVQYKDSAKAIFKHLAPHLKQKAKYYQAGDVDVLSRFADPESDLMILVAVDGSLRLGHNLQAANCVIHADSVWLPGDMRQREARANRLKQQKIVYIYHIVVRNSAEIAKTARLLSAEHMISKANSDFTDTETLPLIKMSLENLRKMRTMEDLDPFIKAQQKHEKYLIEQRGKEKEFYGTQMYTPSKAELKEVEKIVLVPSTKKFNGNLNSIDKILMEELENLPSSPKTLSKIRFHLQYWDKGWQLIAFKDADPQGFLRRLGFKLRRNYFFHEIPNKGGLSLLMDQIERKSINILNKSDLVKDLNRATNLESAPRGTLRQLLNEDRQLAVAKAPEVNIEFKFATISKHPFVYADTVDINSDEAKRLKSLGFELGAPFWYMNIKRTELLTLLKKIEHSYPELKIVDLDKLSQETMKAFGVDLVREFPNLAVEA